MAVPSDVSSKTSSKHDLFFLNIFLFFSQAPRASLLIAAVPLPVTQPAEALSQNTVTRRHRLPLRPPRNRSGDERRNILSAVASLVFSSFSLARLR